MNLSPLSVDTHRLFQPASHCGNTVTFTKSKRAGNILEVSDCTWRGVRLIWSEIVPSVCECEIQDLFFRCLIRRAKSLSMNLWWNQFVLGVQHFIYVCYKNETWMKHWWNERRLQYTLYSARTKMQSDKPSHPLDRASQISSTNRAEHEGLRGETENTKQTTGKAVSAIEGKR